MTRGSPTHPAPARAVGRLKRPDRSAHESAGVGAIPCGTHGVPTGTPADLMLVRIHGTGSDTALPFGNAAQKVWRMV